MENDKKPTAYCGFADLVPGSQNRSKSAISPVSSAYREKRSNICDMGKTFVSHDRQFLIEGTHLTKDSRNISETSIVSNTVIRKTN